MLRDAREFSSLFWFGLVVLPLATGVGVAWALNQLAVVALLLGLPALLLVLHRPRFGLWLMMLTLPFVAAFTRHPIERMVDFGLPGLVLGLCFMEFLHGRRKLVLPPRSLTLWFFLFVIWMIFTSFFSPAPIKGFAQGVRYCFLFFALLAFWNLWDLGTLRKGLLVVGSLLVVGAGYGIWELVTMGGAEVVTRVVENRRLSSFFYNPNIMGVWMGHGLVILLPYFLRRCSGRWTLGRGTANGVVFALVVVLVVGLMIPLSRASYLYAFFGLVTLIVMHRRLRWVALATGGAALAALFLTPLPQWASLGLRLQSGESFRSHLWEAGWRMMIDHPWTGVGTGSGVFASMRGPYLSPSTHCELINVKAGGAHNVFVSAGAEMGIPGLLLVLWFFAMVWVRIPGALRDYRRGDWLAGAAAAGVVGLTVRGIFERSTTLGLGNVGDSIVFFLFALILIGRHRWGQPAASLQESPLPGEARSGLPVDRSR